MANPPKRNGPLKDKNGEYPAEFENAKNSKYSEGSKKTTGYSSAQPDSYSIDYYDGKSKPNISGGSDSEPARQSRLGRSNTQTGPKPRDFPFLKHTIKDNK